MFLQKIKHAVNNSTKGFRVVVGLVILIGTIAILGIAFGPDIHNFLIERYDTQNCIISQDENATKYYQDPVLYREYGC